MNILKIILIFPVKIIAKSVLHIAAICAVAAAFLLMVVQKFLGTALCAGGVTMIISAVIILIVKKEIEALWLVLIGGGGILFSDAVQKIINGLIGITAKMLDLSADIRLFE